MNFKQIVLLTSTVNPSIVGKHTRTPEERKAEYLKAVLFYFAKTPYSIVIVDNSNFNFYNCMPKSERFEALCFQGENNGKGKGWGELQIIKYAFQNSTLLQNADQIIKITGRLIISNITSIAACCVNMNDVYADADWGIEYPHSYLFVAPPRFYKEALFPRHEMMNDSKGVHFEHVLGYSINSWRKEYKFHEFRIPLIIEGHPGDSNKPYLRPSIKRYILIFIKYILNEIRNLKM